MSFKYVNLNKAMCCFTAIIELREEKTVTITEKQNSN